MTRSRPGVLAIRRQPPVPLQTASRQQSDTPGTGAHWFGRTRRRSSMGPFLVPFVMIAIFGLMVLALGHP